MSFNATLAEKLQQISVLMELLGEDSFRASANARASRSVEGVADDLSKLTKAQLVEIPGIGAKIADKIVEMGQTGQIKELDELAAKVPPGLLAILRIPGLGPKTVRMFWQEAGVTDIAGLKKIIDDGSILKLPRMGAKSVDKIKESLAFATDQTQQRAWIGLAMPLAEAIVERMRKLKGVEQAEFAGSLRRGKESIGDIDVLITLKDPKLAPVISEEFRKMPGVQRVLAGGETKSSVMLDMGADLGRWGGDEEAAKSTGGSSIQVDLRILPKESFGAALMYFSGSKEHNVALRERAQKRGLTLNEYGLFPEDDQDTPPQARGVKPIASATETQIYKALDLPFIPPEIRESRGEIDLESTPKLIELDDIKAELHAHTTASDGSLSIEQLAREAHKRGFHTIAVTDHSKSSAIAGGLNEERLLAHIKAIRHAQKVLHDDGVKITILAGSEVDILADGTLDYNDDLLTQLDIVVASPHVATRQEDALATKRLLKAITHPLVHILGHPTARLINRRPGLSPAIGELIAAAKEHKTALEINAHWMRLDLRDTHVRAAVDAGCTIAINCDVHMREDYDNLRYGVLTARRGWLTPNLCVNTWPATKLHAWLKSKGRD